MQLIRDLRSKLAIGGELLVFLWRRKMWWMTPIVAVMLLFGILIATGSSTGYTPIIYTLF